MLILGNYVFLVFRYLQLFKIYRKQSYILIQGKELL